MTRFLDAFEHQLVDATHRRARGAMSSPERAAAQDLDKAHRCRRGTAAGDRRRCARGRRPTQWRSRGPAAWYPASATQRAGCAFAGDLGGRRDAGERPGGWAVLGRTVHHHDPRIRMPAVRTCRARRTRGYRPGRSLLR